MHRCHSLGPIFRPTQGMSSKDSSCGGSTPPSGVGQVGAGTWKPTMRCTSASHKAIRIYTYIYLYG